MNKLKITSILLSTFFLFSCNDKAKNESAETSQATKTEVHEHSNDETIQLNDGQKWKVDVDMMAHIRIMENDVTSFDKETPENYQLLADNLKKNIDLLTSNCTMKGEAHDELHKWLLPYIELVDDFSKDKSNENLAKIQESFTTFNQYFQ
jgi:hypothetical protein